MKLQEELNHTIHLEIGEEDILFLSSNFPELVPNNSEVSKITKIEGTLNFIAEFQKKTKKYIIYDGLPDLENRYVIRDSYQIELDLFSDINPFREVKEIGGRIKKVANDRGEDTRDLHIYDDNPERSEDNNKVCLAGYFDEPSELNLKEFICEFVIPFFYDQSFYRDYGIWPRREYSHGCLGILENYYDALQKGESSEEAYTIQCINYLKELKTDNRDPESMNNLKKLLDKEKIKPNPRCINNRCHFYKYEPLKPFRNRYWGSKKNPLVSNFSSCHHVAFEGLKKLHENVRKYNLINEVYEL